MIHIDEGDYSVPEIMAFANILVDESAKYMESVICNYASVPHESEVFSDVLLIRDYEVNPNPTGSIRRSLRGRRGLYVFIVTKEVTLSKKEVYAYCDGYNGAGFKDQFKQIHLFPGQHFYQGSVTSQSLLSRINTHYSDKSKPAGIHLGKPERKIMRDKLELYVFPVRDILKDQDVFIKMIEAALHERKPAATGSKRV